MLMAFGGIGIHFVAMQGAGISPKRFKSLFMSILATMFNASALVFAIFNFLNNYIPMMILFLVHAGFQCVMILFGSIFQPYHTFKEIEQPEDEKRFNLLDSLRDLYQSFISQRFKDQVLTLKYLLIVIYACCNVTNANWYLGTLRIQLKNMGDDSLFALIFNYMFILIFLFMLTYGYIYDRLGKVISFVICISLLILSLSILCVPILFIQPIGFVCYIFGRSFFFSCFFNMIRNDFDGKDFGKLVGMAMVTAGFFGQIQIFLSYLTNYVFKGRYLFSNLFIIFLSLISFVCPLYLWKEGKKNEEIESTNIEEIKDEENSEVIKENIQDKVEDSFDNLPEKTIQSDLKDESNI